MTFEVIINFLKNLCLNKVLIKLDLKQNIQGGQKKVYKSI